MKILGISCSPRKKGNTDIMIRHALEGAQNEGAKGQFLSLRDLHISPCDGCGSCQKTGICHIDDDMMKVYDEMEKSQGIIIGSPVYFWSVSGQAKIMIDRTYALRFPKLRLVNKVGGAILVAAKRGCMSASAMLNYWMISHHMLPSDLVDGYASARGDIEKDSHAIKGAFELGRLVVKLVNKGFAYPEEFDQPIYKFVEKKYGIKLGR
jgi:multimeric flavodoxin WrbA